MEASEHKKDPAFLKYVYELTAGTELMESFRMGLNDIDHLDFEQLKKIGLKTYEKDKWTIHTILQHLIDWERIWCFRAILFARQEGTIPVAHDQEIMGNNSNANKRELRELLAELRIVRQSSIAMFETFDEEMLRNNCNFFEYEMPLSAIGFTIVAHQIHHFKIIEERYFHLA